MVNRPIPRKWLTWSLRSPDVRTVIILRHPRSFVVCSAVRPPGSLVTCILLAPDKCVIDNVITARNSAESLRFARRAARFYDVIHPARRVKSHGARGLDV
jgi:hypothetical protein